MKTLQFDFTVDKTTNTVLISREFAADLSLVWDAFTKQEILDQWWAPKPLASKTKSMDFKVGGKRFYAMVTPEGQENYGIQEYTAINPKTILQWASSFAKVVIDNFLSENGVCPCPCISMAITFLVFDSSGINCPQFIAIV